MISTHNDLEQMLIMRGVAAEVAETTMQNHGRFAATYFASIPGQVCVISRPGLPDEQVDSSFAQRIRLICMTHGATAGILAARGTMICRRAEILDVSGPWTPQPAECIYLFGETVSGHQAVTCFRIIRGEKGEFLGFDSPEDLLLKGGGGCFPRFLSLAEPSEAERQLARRLLLSGDVRIERIPAEDNESSLAE